jgi:hypothetical protein
MNKILFPLLLLIIPAVLYSQESQSILIGNNKVAADQLGPEYQQIFPDFRTSRVFYKGLSPINCKANYNFLLDEIHYLDEKGDTMAIANPKDLSYVMIGDRMFISSEKGFLEVIEKGDVSLVYKWICRIRSKSREGALGISTDAPGVYQMNRISFDSREWNMKVNEEGLASVEVLPYLKTKSRIISITGETSFLKICHNKDSLRKYLNENPVDFHKEMDLRRLTIFVNSLN